MAPFVSCIMPTRNRLRFLPQAIRCFERQKYDNRELIVLDDGDPPGADICAGQPRVQYVRCESPASIGAKMNLGIAGSRGTVIQKWDDDDYYGPDFLRLAVENLMSGPADNSLVAWDCFLILAAGDDFIRFSGHGWTTGATLCFPRTLWEKCAFRDVNLGADACFLRDHDAQIIRVCAPEQFMVVRHGANTWNVLPERHRVDDYLRERGRYRKPLEAYLAPEDIAFYATFMCEEARPARARLTVTDLPPRG